MILFFNVLCSTRGFSGGQDCSARGNGNGWSSGLWGADIEGNCSEVHGEGESKDREGRWRVLDVRPTGSQGSSRSEHGMELDEFVYSMLLAFRFICSISWYTGGN